MRFGCIPVVFSNNWEMPFSDIIDWKKCVVNFDERNINGVNFRYTYII